MIILFFIPALVILFLVGWLKNRGWINGEATGDND